jgi:type 1 glutamine amidotransferase
MMWSFENGRGRVFASIPGHYTWTQDDPLFRLIVFRALAWVAGEESEGFEKLVLPQANTAN